MGLTKNKLANPILIDYLLYTSLVFLFVEEEIIKSNGLFIKSLYQILVNPNFC